MSIYLGNKKGKLYKGDYHPAQFYRGDTKIAGYDVVQKQGTAIECVDTYNDQLNPTIYGKSEQTVTANSPSPDYPSPIRSSENFDVVSCGCDPATATTAHVIDPLRSVGDVWDSIEVSGGKVEVVRRVVRFVNSASAKWYYVKVYSNNGFNCWNLQIYKALTLDGNKPVMCSILKKVYEVWSKNTEGIQHQEAMSNVNAYIWIKLDATKFPDTASLLAKEFYIDYVPNLTPTRTDITATPLGQAMLALRTQPHYTQVYTNATLPPTIRASLKMLTQ